MYCPRCSAENLLQQQYCRKCGLSLPAVALAVEGRIQDAIKSLDRAQKPLMIGTLWIALFVLIVGLTMATDGRVGFANAASAAGFLAVSIPFLIAGALRARQAYRLFHATEASSSLADPGPEARALPGTSPMVTFPEPDDRSSASVTDATTKELKESRNA